MKSFNEFVFIVLTTSSISALGQCANSEMKPVWDAANGQFRCSNPAAPERSSQDEEVSPSGNRDFCTTVRENLLKVCPTSDNGKSCRSKAKSIFKACYKDPKGDRADQTSSTSASACMATFSQRQKECQSRKLPSPSPGQPPVPDTCLQDALTEQTKCLARGSPTSANQSSTDASSCMTAFNEQQKACQSRKLPPPPPGQPPVPDTCLQDALAAQSKCLAKIH